MKKMLAVLSAAAVITQSVPLMSSAKDHYTKTDEKFTYNELMSMSNEEFTELFDYSEYGFGDDSIPDEVKFEELLNEAPSYYVGDNWLSMEYSAYQQFTSKECEAYIPLYVNEGAKMTYEIRAAEFGYPDSWIINPYQDIGWKETHISYNILEYRLYVPVEVIADFETFVRLTESIKMLYSDKLNEKYGISRVGGIYDQFYSFRELNGKVDDEVYQAFLEGNERVGVRLHCTKLERPKLQETDAAADEYIESLDKTQYTETELDRLRYEYRVKLSQEAYEKYVSECNDLLGSVMAEAGIDPNTAYYDDGSNVIYCIVSEEQLCKAEQSENVTAVTLSREIEKLSFIEPELYDIDAPAEPVTDNEAIKKLFAEFLESSGLDEFVSFYGDNTDERLPVMLQYSVDEGIPYSMALLKFAKEANISRERISFVPIENGVPITTCVAEETNTLSGDANCDNSVNLADAVMIMQSVMNPDRYQLTEQGRRNADVDGEAGITNKDALKIQQYKLCIINTL